MSRFVRHKPVPEVTEQNSADLAPQGLYLPNPNVTDWFLCPNCGGITLPFFYRRCGRCCVDCAGIAPSELPRLLPRPPKLMLELLQDSDVYLMAAQYQNYCSIAHRSGKWERRRDGSLKQSFNHWKSTVCVSPSMALLSLFIEVFLLSLWVLLILCFQDNRTHATVLPMGAAPRFTAEFAT